jgi:hypothetical protein
MVRSRHWLLVPPRRCVAEGRNGRGSIGECGDLRFRCDLTAVPLGPPHLPNSSASVAPGYPLPWTCQSHNHTLELLNGICLLACACSVALAVRVSSLKRLSALSSQDDDDDSCIIIRKSADSTFKAGGSSMGAVTVLCFTFSVPSLVPTVSCPFRAGVKRPERETDH